MTRKSFTDSLLSDLIDFINSEGNNAFIKVKNKTILDLREFIDEAKADGVNITRKQALADIKELEAMGFWKVIKKIDKNRFLIEHLELPSNEHLLPGFEPSKF